MLKDLDDVWIFGHCPDRRFLIRCVWQLNFPTDREPIAMTGTPNWNAASDTRIVRMLMLRAGLDEHSAARELEIEEEKMQSYARGEAIPRSIVFALMRLADLGHTLRPD
jgi:hypothetical protein